MISASGRFETGVKICLSMSSHHPEHWQPSWSVRVALVALIAFLPTSGQGAIGSLVSSRFAPYVSIVQQLLSMLLGMLLWSSPWCCIEKSSYCLINHTVKHVFTRAAHCPACHCRTSAKKRSVSWRLSHERLLQNMAVKLSSRSSMACMPAC